MFKSRLFSLAALLVLAVAGRAAPPAEVSKLIEDHLKEREEARKKFEEQQRQHRVTLLDQLEKLQKKYTQAGKLEDAMAIKEEIQKLRANVIDIKAQPFPGSIPGGAENIGKSFVYEITGAIGGSVWGTDVYTTDSSLAAVVVHAGVVQNGQKGIVRVTILPGQQAYQGTTRNGVTTSAWPAYPTSYRVEAVR
jgi:hypothetical protein